MSGTAITSNVRRLPQGGSWQRSSQGESIGSGAYACAWRNKAIHAGIVEELRRCKSYRRGSPKQVCRYERKEKGTRIRGPDLLLGGRATDIQQCHAGGAIDAKAMTKCHRACDRHPRCKAIEWAQDSGMLKSAGEDRVQTVEQVMGIASALCDTLNTTNKTGTTARQPIFQEW